MDINMFIQIVNGVGFPIAACIAMGIFIVWDKKTKFKEKEEYQNKQNEILKTILESVNNNSRTIEKLINKLGE